MLCSVRVALAAIALATSAGTAAAFSAYPTGVPPTSPPTPRLRAPACRSAQGAALSATRAAVSPCVPGGTRGSWSCARRCLIACNRRCD